MTGSSTEENGGGSDKCGDSEALKLLDLPRFPPRPATSIQSELKGGRNGNMLEIGGILPTQVTRLKRKAQEESGYKTQDC